MVVRQVMTLQQVASYLAVHPNTVYRLARQGKLPAFKVGSDWRFNRESIDRWRLDRERELARAIAASGSSGRGLRPETADGIAGYVDGERR